jgi:NhaA family Na+:H+ antiporter
VNGPRRRALFGWLRPGELLRVGEILRTETVGGLLLLIAATAALVWANWPGSDSYANFVGATFGPSALHLHLSVAKWAGDGLLAIFFFAAGLEVKREFVGGSLNSLDRAILPVLAAVGGMVVPAVVFVLVNVGEPGTLRGWAIPSATDIAFALAVLAVLSTHLPAALRTFLLTLAVVDDLLAIIIIAMFYTGHLRPVPLLVALLPIAAFGAAVQRRIRSWWLLLPLAFVAWALVHASGVHATVAGVALALTVPVLRSEAAGGPQAGRGLAEHFEHRIRPVSAGVAVPIFALCSAGVTVSGWSGLRDALSDRVALGIIGGLVVGKGVGIFATTYLVARFTRADLGEGLAWADVAGVALLGGIGFTVSLLIGELAYGSGSPRDDHAKIGVFAGSLLAALLAAVVLRARNRAYRRLEAEPELLAE